MKLVPISNEIKLFIAFSGHMLINYPPEYLLIINSRSNEKLLIDFLNRNLWDIYSNWSGEDVFNHIHVLIGECESIYNP